MANCCEAMSLVLGRVRDTQTVGLMMQQFLSHKSGDFFEDIVIRFHKGPRGDKSENRNVICCMVNYCPFCGKKVERKA